MVLQIVLLFVLFLVLQVVILLVLFMVLHVALSPRLKKPDLRQFLPLDVRDFSDFRLGRPWL